VLNIANSELLMTESKVLNCNLQSDNLSSSYFLPILFLLVISLSILAYRLASYWTRTRSSIFAFKSSWISATLVILSCIKYLILSILVSTEVILLLNCYKVWDISSNSLFISFKILAPLTLSWVAFFVGVPVGFVF